MRLNEKYKKEAVPEMMKRFKYKSVMAAPKITKVVVNCGFGNVVVNKGAGEREKIEEHISEYLALIAGQKPSLRKAKKSIATFKLREGLNIGLAVTLRGRKMYDFLERTISLALPRTRDFRGIPLGAIDKAGNLTISFKEYTPFSEVKLEREKGIFGFQAVVVMENGKKEERIELLKMLGFPLSNQ